MSTLFAMALIVCVLFCGLTIDIGRMELEKIQMQSAADAAAVGAELETERGTWNWQTMGKSDASLNGFTDGQNGATVTVIQDPTSGAYVGRYDAIQVTITQTLKTLFMGTLNGGSYTLTVRSVALVPTCNYFLGAASASYTYTFQNQSATLNSSCPIYVNYSDSVDYFSDFFGFGANVSGPSSASYSQGWESQQSQGPTWPQTSLAPTFGSPAMADPLASITQPVFSSCDKTSYKLTTGSAILNPGTYCGTASTVGMTVTNASVTLNPGLYVITGGAVWDKATVTGAGVTLFFTKGNGAQYGQLLVSGSGPSTLTLSAPTDTSAGGLAGILFFADRNWVATGGADFSFNTNGSFTGDGIWYLPGAGIYIWANSFSNPRYRSILARNIYFFGTTINGGQDFSTFSGGSPFRTQPVLVE
jgi:hypothetical protein